MSNISTSKQINDIVAFLKPFIKKSPPKIGLVLGSGLGAIAENISSKTVIPYADIPHFSKATAPGHAGNLILGKLSGKSVIIMQGRLHIYEGYHPAQATLLVRVMKKLGVNTLILTCAAGGLNYHFCSGEIMVITDHLNLSGVNPLVGENLAEFGPRFPSMFDIYTQQLQDLAHRVALRGSVRLCRGVYAAILGPCYATRAELHYLIKNGGDAIGMSIVQEAIVAKHCGMKVLGLAAITDMALPFATEHASEMEIVETAKKTAGKFKQLIKGIIEEL